MKCSKCWVGINEGRRMRARPRFMTLFLAGLVGCGSLTGSREQRPPTNAAMTESPTPKALIGVVNRNAAKIESLEATDLGLEVKQGKQGGGLSGALFCQKPRNFRLRAKAV